MRRTMHLGWCHECRGGARRWRGLGGWLVGWCPGRGSPCWEGAVKSGAPVVLAALGAYHRKVPRFPGNAAIIRPSSAFAVPNASLSTNRIPESALHRAAPASSRRERALTVRDLPPP